MYIDLAQTEHSWRDLYRLYITFIQPRPIALASTIGADGVGNLAPFSFYNMLSAHPPVVVFCPSINRSGQKKDTLVNIEQTREFVIATVTESIAERMNVCSVEFPHGVSEFDQSGLTPVPATKVRAALVKESPVNIECTLRQVLYFGEGPGAGAGILGDIVAVHVDESVLVPGDLLCDPGKLQAIGRMGTSFYTRTADRFSLDSIRDPQDWVAKGPTRVMR